jgi:hypothetical protein
MSSTLNLTSKVHIRCDKWDISVDGEGMVQLNIDRVIDIDDLTLTLISDVRIPITSLKVTSHKMSFPMNVCKPTFGQLGDSVKYVTGSGNEFYKKNCQINN